MRAHRLRTWGKADPPVRYSKSRSSNECRYLAQHHGGAVQKDRGAELCLKSRKEATRSGEPISSNSPRKGGGRRLPKRGQP